MPRLPLRPKEPAQAPPLLARPEESLYIGDVYSVDYVGANRRCMQAMLMDMPGAYRDKGVPRVESLGELQITLRDGDSRKS